MKVKLNAFGISTVAKNMQRAAGLVHSGLAKAVEQQTNAVAELSQQRVPIDEVVLKPSMVIEKFDVGEAVSMSITYSVTDSENGFNYALIQHEEYPVKRTPGTTFKYLEHPNDEEQPNFIPRVKRVIQGVLE